MTQHPPLAIRVWRRRWVVAAAFGIAVGVGCSHNANPDEDDAPVAAPPIIVHVRNENFADVNVAVVVSGVSRRLGTVTGNSISDFTISWSVANGQTVVLTALQIGGRGEVVSPGLSVGPGQVIEFKVGSVFRQSTATVHDP